MSNLEFPLFVTFIKHFRRTFYLPPFINVYSIISLAEQRLGYAHCVNLHFTPLATAKRMIEKPLKVYQLLLCLPQLVLIVTQADQHHGVAQKLLTALQLILQAPYLDTQYVRCPWNVNDEVICTLHFRFSIYHFKSSFLITIVSPRLVSCISI